jgi:hypothetical protein
VAPGRVKTKSPWREPPVVWWDGLGCVGGRPYFEGWSDKLGLPGLQILHSKLFIALNLDNVSIMNGYCH